MEGAIPERLLFFSRALVTQNNAFQEANIAANFCAKTTRPAFQHSSLRR